MRLDRALMQRGLARSRSQAQELIRSGKVSAAGVIFCRPAAGVDASTVLDVKTDPWVSRGAHKLLGALDDTGLVVPSRVLDAGASTGGFTQVLLTRGARTVYAVDVGHEQLAPQLRDDPRVIDLPGINLRYLSLDVLDGEPVPLIVGDVSFISLRLVLAPLRAVLALNGMALLLVKPQFEVGRAALGAGGVVRDEAARRAAVDGVVASAAELGLLERWRGPARLSGPAGNQEYFILLSRAD